MVAWARNVASVGRVGTLPWAPGTWASLLCLGPVYLLRDLTVVPFVSLWLVLAVLGAWAADIVEREKGLVDPGFIVIDEVVGMLVAATFIDRSSVLQLFTAFALFRGFDMLKPWPVSAIEQRVRGGAGVIADDVAAGLCAALVMKLLF